MQRWVGRGIKEMREASSEFDSVIALTSETVTRGVSFSPAKMSPQGSTIFHQSVSQLYTVYRTQLGYIH